MKDYIIFDKAPKIILTSTTAIADWYSNTTESSERIKLNVTVNTADCSSAFIISGVAAELKIRGNYTANYSKKPFQIKFSEKQNLFGLSKGKAFKKWILLAEYNDSSMLRNALGFYAGQQFLGKDAWSPSFTYVQVYIQDPQKLYYMGMYLLCDQKEQAKNRVNVFEPEDSYEGTDIGYFFERDDYFDTETDPTFTIENSEYEPVGLTRTDHESNQWARQHGGQVTYDGFTIHSKITNEASQVTYLKDRLLKIYTILYNAVNNGVLYELDTANNLIVSSETDPEKVLRKTIELDSFINMYILHEMACNPDIGHSSFYFSLDMSESGDKLLHLTCPWDFDLALGITRRFAEDPASAGLWAKECTLNPWVSLLVHADWFKALVDKRWQELYDQGILYKLLQMLDDYSRVYENDFIQNFTEWDLHFELGNNKTWNLDTSRTTPKRFIRANYYTEAQSEADCKEYFKEWLNNRFIQLHSEFNGQGSTDWPEPPEVDSTIFRKDKLVQAYTIESWNEAYNNPDDEMGKYWNQLYDNKEDAGVQAFNEMYQAIEKSQELSPTDEADAKAWNENAAK